MKHSDDQSIFAWVDREAPSDSLHRLLTTSPSKFAGCHAVFPYDNWDPRPPCSMTNRGLRIDLHITRHGKDIYVAALDCPSPPEYNDCSFLAIFLKKLPTGHRQYARIKVGNMLEAYELGQMETIYVRQSIVAPELTGALPHHILQLRDVPHPSTHPTTYRAVNVVVPSARLKPPEPIWSLESRKSVPAQWPVTFRMHKASKHLAAFIVFWRDDGKELLIMLGSEDGFNVGFDALDTSDIGDRDMSGFKAMSNYFTSPKKPGTYLVLDNHLMATSRQGPALNSQDHQDDDKSEKSTTKSSKIRGRLSRLFRR
ncbi:hypothetical protein VTN00DRAFT_8667 [Thermoascus crustaceus]|uniref:uncharacterized protein n=1 Tax=Thermoascus crustaceus TaxID=5088 RepID=UPI003741F603